MNNTITNLISNGYDSVQTIEDGALNLKKQSSINTFSKNQTFETQVN